MMKIWLLMLVAVVAVAAPAFADEDSNLIVPGLRIGPALLGMTAAQIAAVNESSKCPVTAKYDAGRAIWLETPFAGVCKTAGGVWAGGQDFELAKSEFGDPNPLRVIKERDYDKVTAYWVFYDTQGIAFRILRFVLENGEPAIIQALAVFPPKK